MAFEIVPAPHLPPYVCMACGCANGEPHVFIPHNQAWEQAYPFICKPCVAEMAGALGITNAEPLALQGTPTPEKIAAYIAATSRLGPASAVILLDKPAPPDEPKVTCPCGAEFTGPTAKAKLGSHKRTCEIAKMAETRGGEAPGKATAYDAG